MKTLHKHTRSLIGALSFVFAPTVHSAEIIPITSFDPGTFFADGITAGIDFDTDSSSDPGFQAATQAGFLSVPANNNLKAYNVTHNGITFDIKTINANQANQSRWRNKVKAGDLINDFQQWYGVHAESGNAVEVAITLTGLLPNTDYQVGFFTFNLGAGQTTHKFYEGTSSADPLITTFTTAGNENNYATWVPGITFQINSGSNSEIAITIQGNEYLNTTTGNNDSRVTFCGMSVVSLAPDTFPLTITKATPPATGYNFEWASQPGKIYDLLTSTDLATPVSEWPVYDNGETLYKDIPSAGATTTLTAVASADPRRFFAMRENDAPPPPPLLEENFEDAVSPAPPAGWTRTDNGAGTVWEIGTPAGGAQFVPAAAAVGTQCAGTNINAQYTADADASLTSPAFTVPATGATLEYWQYIDTEPSPSGDLGSIRLLNAADNSFLADVVPGIEGVTTAWSEQSVDLPAAANGVEVKLEFRFTSNASDNWGGFYIDDIVVTSK